MVNIMKKFKELRLTITNNAIKEAQDKIYNGSSYNNEYIRRQLISFIGEIEKYLPEYGVDVSLDVDRDNSFSIRHMRAFDFVKGYKTCYKYIEAIARISALFEIYDNKEA